MTATLLRRLLLPAAVAGALANHSAPSPTYLFVWAGDSAGLASDFLAVIDATPSSPHYGAVVASVPTGMAGTHPHHTEAEMPANGHLLANGFHAGRTWLFDLTDPLHPRILTSFGDVAGYSHPHTYFRLTDGNILATFQYVADTTSAAMGEAMAMTHGAMNKTGGLVEMDERGRVIKRGSARDAAIADSMIYPYSVLPLPNMDRAVSTTTDMDEDDTLATSQWVQIWRLSDLTLLKSVALPPGPLGHEQLFTGEPRLLPDGRSVYIHTFGCGLYLLRDVDGAPRAMLAYSFEGMNCGVPILTGHYWLQTVPAAHALVALDITDPVHPHQAGSVSFGPDERPHWVAIDPTGRRLVVNSGGYAKSNRLFIVNFDPASGALAIDDRFHDAGDPRPGIDLSNKTWPHGFSGRANPHGTVFSR